MATATKKNNTIRIVLFGLVERRIIMVIIVNN